MHSREIAYKISTMLYTAAQTTTFIKNPEQMGVSACTHQYIADNEGLVFFHELIDYLETDTWKKKHG